MGNFSISLERNPRTQCMIIDLYEGLAKACENLEHELQTRTVNRSAVEAELRRSAALYKGRVGTDYCSRRQLRQQAAAMVVART